MKNLKIITKTVLIFVLVIKHQKAKGRSFLSLQSSKFKRVGPMVTITLNEPFQDSNGRESTLSAKNKIFKKGILNLCGLNPSINWSCIFDPQTSSNYIHDITSNKISLFFNEFLSRLKYCSFSTFFNHQDMENSSRYSKVQGLVRFNMSRNFNIEIEPIYFLNKKKSIVNVKLGKDDVYSWIKFSSMHGKNMIESIIGSYKTRVPFMFFEKENNFEEVNNDLGKSSIIQIQPCFNLIRNKLSCKISASSSSSTTTITSTTAVLDLEIDDPTLLVIHELDERNKISPKVSLKNGKITYHWESKLGDNSCIVTKVDPTKAIQITWLDCCNGHDQVANWITDVHFPLSVQEAYALNNGKDSSFIAHVRVRRQFVF